MKVTQEIIEYCGLKPSNVEYVDVGNNPNSFVKTKAMDKVKEEDEDDYEIEFIPDFDLDGDDDDNS